MTMAERALQGAPGLAGQAGHDKERDRLAALAHFDVMDGPKSEPFDRITRLVRRILDVPIATVAFIDGHRLWFKSRVGLGADEAPRERAFCERQIESRTPLVLRDTLADGEFANAPLVAGPPFIRFYAGVPLITEAGHVIGTLCAMDTRPRDVKQGELDTLADLAAIVMDELELQLLANTDPLTGALTRRALRDEATRWFALARRSGNDLSCVTLDLDHFKRINDDHGHPIGDVVLVELVKLLRRELRASDVIGRTGGEEFVVILPNVGRKAARETAERLRTAVAGQVFSTPAGELGLSASFGVAVLGAETPDLDTLLDQADVALYRAKERGRNRVAEAGDEDKRHGGRHRVLKGARISFNGGRSVLDCTVRNLSETGAGLDVTTSVGVPAEFVLLIDADGVSRSCRVAWRTGRKMGVEFL